MKIDKKNIDFEAAMLELETAVKKLESGNMPLEESLKTFEEAIALVKICNEKLENAERRVRILVENTDGTLTDKVFAGSDDEA